MDIYLASGNAHKLEEIQAMLGALPVTLYSAKALGGMPEVDENAPDLKGNARLKARALQDKAPDGAWVLSDDTGLFVDALDGAPGVRSARYAGEKATYADNNAKLLAALANIPPAQRRAHFACVFCLLGENEEHYFEGRVQGSMLEALRGGEGFGYDPLFVPDGHDKSFAELGAEIKNSISHRAAAATALKQWLRQKTI